MRKREPVAIHSTIPSCVSLAASVCPWDRNAGVTLEQLPRSIQTTALVCHNDSHHSPDDVTARVPQTQKSLKFVTRRPSWYLQIPCNFFNCYSCSSLIISYFKYFLGNTLHEHAYVARNKIHIKSSILWNITPCSPLKVCPHLGVTCHLSLQVRRISQPWN